MKKLLLLLFLTAFMGRLASAQDGCGLRISLLTCAPGEELYSTFGHTALRVQDSAMQTDYVFNYGTFEFGPDFYTKFIKGRLLYFLSVEDFRDFVYQYELESRSIDEQVLQLSCEEKQKLYSALRVNAQLENRYYKYDFLFDNCTTRAGDIVAANTTTPVRFDNILPEQKPTFRNLLHTYLDAGHQHWSKLGIDILLGAKLDRKVTNHQSMFLPDYLEKGFDHAFVNGHPLASPAQTILKMPSPLKDAELFTPAIVFTLLLVLVLAASFAPCRWTASALRVFDFLFFFVLGLAGILLLFMWFGTDHKVTQNNYNLIWTLPAHALMAFLTGSKKQWVRNYFSVVLFISVALALTWFFLPQQMNPALIPVLLLIIFRSWHLSKIKSYAGKRNLA